MPFDWFWGLALFGLLGATMGLNAKRVALVTTGVDTTQDITITEQGTPKGAIVFITRSTLDNSDATHCGFAVGAMDGTNQRCIAISAENGVNTSNAFTKYVNNALAILLDTNTGDINAVATGSLITDGIRLTIKDAFPAAYYIEVIFIVGTAYDVDLVAVDSETDTSFTTGTQPDFIFAAGVSKHFVTPSAYSTVAADAHAQLSMGILTRNTGGSEVQGCIGFHYKDAVASGGTANEGYNYLSNSALLLVPDHDATYSGISVATTSTGGTITDVGGGYYTVGFMLCVNFGGEGSVYSGTQQYPASTTNPFETTGLPHTPSFVLELLSLCPNITTEVKGYGIAAGVGLAFADSPNDLAISFRANNNSSSSSPTVAGCNTSQNKIQSFRTPDMALDTTAPIDDALRATFTSFDASGYTRNVTVASALRRMHYFTFATVVPGQPAARRLGRRLHGVDSVRVF